MKNNKNKLLEWFTKEGALFQDGNLYVANRVFIANSVVNWAKSSASSLKEGELDYIMKTLRLFLQNKIELRWADGRIEIVPKVGEATDIIGLELQTKKGNQ